MATIIKPRRSSTASGVPTTANLADGEWSINYTDKIMYLRVGAAIIAVANFSNAGAWGSITGTLSAQTDLQNALNLKANLAGAAFTGAVSFAVGSYTGTGVNFGSSGAPASGATALFDATHGGFYTQRNDGAARFGAISAGTTQPQLITARSNGTLTAPTAVAANVNCGDWYGFAYDGTVWGTISAITHYASELQTATAHGGYLSFSTTSNGTTATTRRWLMQHNGHLEPFIDNTYNLGAAAARAKTLFAYNGDFAGNIFLSTALAVTTG